MEHDLRKAAEMAFEAMDKEPDSWQSWIHDMEQAKEALRQALAQPEQEPVAWYGVDTDGEKYLGWDKQDLQNEGFAWVVPLYTQPVDAVNMSQECVDETAKLGHEPVAWISEGGDVSRSKRYFEEMGFRNLQPLYTAPPKREWVGLTDEEIQHLWSWLSKSMWMVSLLSFAQAIEAKLKEVNG